jgi:hypothetical protein
MNDVTHVEITKTLTIPSIRDQLYEEAQQVIQALEPAAKNNVTGPEAVAQRRLKSQTKAMLIKLGTLQNEVAKHPPGSKQHQAALQKMGVITNAFRNELKIIRLKHILPKPPTTLDKLKKRFPYIDKVMKERGAVVPGIPGSFVPLSPIDPDKTPKRQRTGPQPAKDDTKGGVWQKSF